MASDDKQNEFVRELARFLVSESAVKTVHLQMGQPHARAWDRLRRTVPGLAESVLSVEQAVQIINDFLWAGHAEGAKTKAEEP